MNGYRYQIKEVNGNSEKYGVCEISGKATQDMVLLVKYLPYERGGRRGLSRVSDCFCDRAEAVERVAATN